MNLISRIRCRPLSSEMKKLGIELLLVSVALLSTLGFIITYIIAVYKGHVTPDLPYISDTGGKPPESCVFSLICFCLAATVAIVVYVRYRHIHLYHLDTPGIRYLNSFTLILGLISAFGVAVVGSFQNDLVPVVHFIGAAMVFGVGVTYEWFQTYISYKIYHANLTRHVSSIVIALRLILCICSTTFFTIAVITALLASHYRGTNFDSTGTFHWTKQEKGFALHVTSTASEWAASGAFCIYFLTFHPDFRRIWPEVNIHLRHSVESNGITESTPLTI